MGEKSHLESFKDINDLLVNEMKLFGNKMQIKTIYFAAISFIAIGEIVDKTKDQENMLALFHKNQ